ncbi:hypothetical protein B0H17DRAFT_1213726 [Mycena rosella]|uniref:Uncharacterized protein n=1 Tax=Mycena rosella TaxID=1033263 RepID=A0AAD7G1P9_MYCRO|nr:hypothetical protein B0H17DRAFT_1213726 [Mycena rosella]
MVAPDGFSKATTKPVTKPSAPKFTSAFDAVSAPAPAPGPAPVPARRASIRFVDSDAPNPVKPNRAVRALKPPVPLFNSGSKPAVDSVPAPRLPPLPVFPPPVSRSAALRQLAPPPAPSAPIASSSKSTTSLKPLVPPPYPAPAQAPSSDRTLRTISTTLIARATDLFTDNGASELASIFLHDQHPDIQWQSAPDDVDERRGIMMSPEKAGKGKEKFLRNGLAARAAVLYDRSHSSLSLWEAEMAHSLSSSASSFRRGLNPDMRLRIVHILHVPSPVPHPSSMLSIPGVALCHLLATPIPDPLGLSRSKDAICAVLFSFSSLSPPVQTPLAIRNPEDFAEGNEVYVWKPWQSIMIDPSAMKLDPETHSDPTVGDVEAAAFQLFAPGATGARRRGTILETALVCERFVVLK